MKLGVDKIRNTNARMVSRNSVKLQFSNDMLGSDLRAGLEHFTRGRRVEAEGLYRRVRADPATPVNRKAHATHLLGLLARECGHLEAAVGLLAESVELLPPANEAVSEFRSNWAAALGELGRWEEAFEATGPAVEGAAGYSPAFHNRSVALDHLGRAAEAVAAADRAVALEPEYAEAHLHRADVLRKVGRLHDAEAAYYEAARLRPTDANTLRSLATLLADRQRLDEAVGARRRAVDLAPHWAGAGSDLLFTLHYHPDYGPREHHEEARAWAARHADPHAPVDAEFPNRRDPERRLRVGYVSPDLRDHPVGRLIEPAVALHDRAAFEVFCYSEVAKPDHVSRHVRDLADGWVDTPGLSDEEVADKVRADRIDILVDCAGHFGDHRLGVFARRPAPVQVSAFGYCGTTGLKTIDYRLTDPVSDPPGADEFHSEKLWRLPRVAWCYRPFDGAPDVGPLPALESGFVTFGCLNNLVKVTDQVVETWSAILAAMPGSRLILLGPAGDEHTAGRFAAHGVDPARVEVAGRRPRGAYFELHNRIDVGLDPFPFNGDNTICDALWMGVPSVALIGDRFAARRGLAHLAAVGLGHLAAESVEEYVQAAVRLAADLPALAELRAGLRGRVRASPLGDAPGYVADLEAAYRAMWRAWCGAWCGA